MGKRLYNPRLAKIHFSYTVGEVALLYGVHRNTVRRWITDGLPVCDNQRPTLILGRDLAAYLRDKRTAKKQTCPPGHIFCVRCDIPRRPAGNMADYIPSTPALGTLVGLCPNCECVIYQKVGAARLSQVRGELDVTTPRAHSRIGDTTHPLVNSDIK